MVLKRQILAACFILTSCLVFCQTENSDEESRKIRFFIEPCVISGLKHTDSNINRFRFKAIPSMNLGFEINKLSVQLGAYYYKLFEIRYDVRCCCYPCPDAKDMRFTDYSLGIKYRIYDKDKYCIEPFLNIYNETVIYELDYYYHNKEIEQWESDRTPYRNKPFFSLGAYLKYSILDKMDLFIAPTIKFNNGLFAHLPNSRFNIFGAQIGITLYLY
jgi:hypothetical protein